MWLVLDLMVVAIVVLFCILSARRGFVRTIIEVVGFALILLLVNSACKPLADVTYDKYIEPAIINSVNTDKFKESVSELDAELSKEESQQVSEELIKQLDPDNSAVELPDFVKKYINDNDVFENIKTEIDNNITKGVSVAITSASQSAIKPIFSSIITMIYSLILTSVLAIIVSVIARLINRTVNFGLLGKVNRILGGVFGIVKGILVCALICTVISAMVNFTDTGIWIFTPKNIENTLIFKLLCYKF